MDGEREGWRNGWTEMDGKRGMEREDGWRERRMEKEIDGEREMDGDRDG